MHLPCVAVSEPIRIANCSGFFGDRLAAAREMVGGGPIDVLTGDWLAELTMMILARSRAKRPGGGYARTFVAQMEQVMGTCLDRGIKVVANAGGLDPGGCAAAVAEVAERLGLAPVVAYVDGDDLLPRVSELLVAGELAPLDDVGLGDPSGYVTANAYLGCWGIVEALRRGADVVVTGRVTDAALVCGPAAWHHGWRRDDWDRLAGAVVAGHILECGAQATGGNYSFFTEISGHMDPGGARFGFPWAEVADDGGALIGKHPRTGGEVSVGTVTAQLLYEIGPPAYLGPDVTARFDTIELTQAAPDRVRVRGVRGEPPPPTLKVGITEWLGYRNSFEIALTGLDVEAKAEFAAAAFWDAYPHAQAELATVDSRIMRTDQPDPATNPEATAVWRLAVRDPDEAKVGRAFTNAMVETGLASIPGFYAPSGAPGPAAPYGVFRAASIPASLVPQRVHLGGGEAVEVGPAAPAAGGVPPPEATPALAPEAPAPAGEARRLAPLGRVVGARSGDKGGDANLGVFARTRAGYAWLAEFLTVDRLRSLLPEVAGLPVERHELANLLALNFVIRGLLGEGVAASTRPDPQAKSLGEWLRARIAPIPESLLTGPPGGVRIRPFSDDDRAGLLDVWERASRVAHDFLPDEFFAREREAISTQHLVRAETWVAELGGRIAGFVSLLGDEVGAVFVDPDRQRRGIGRALLDHVRSGRGPLELEVFAANFRARGFYERYGFVPVGRYVHAESGEPMVRLRWQSP